MWLLQGPELEVPNSYKHQSCAWHIIGPPPRGTQHNIIITAVIIILPFHFTAHLLCLPPESSEYLVVLLRTWWPLSPLFQHHRHKGNSWADPACSDRIPQREGLWGQLHRGAASTCLMQTLASRSQQGSDHCQDKRAAAKTHTWLCSRWGTRPAWLVSYSWWVSMFLGQPKTASWLGPIDPDAYFASSSLVNHSVPGEQLSSYDFATTLGTLIPPYPNSLSLSGLTMSIATKHCQQLLHCCFTHVSPGECSVPFSLLWMVCRMSV